MLCISEQMSSRVRQTPHIDGNFATCITVDVKGENMKLLQSFTEQAKIALLRFGKDPTPILDLHLSLSRQLFLKPHLIDSFLATLRFEFVHARHTAIYLDPSIRVYHNESGNTAFAAIPVDLDLSINCLTLIGKIDSVLRQFDLPEFYENPSPHVSLAYTVKEDWVSVSQSFPTLDLDIADNSLEELRVDVESLTVKIGSSVHVIEFSL